ncbi:MAG: hypothetical protein WDM92_03165 [Caulobacteraceae bacterium]
MRLSLPAILAGVALAASFAQPGAAKPHDADDPRHGATLCLDGLGVGHPPVCRDSDASRFAHPPDICLCHGPYRQVTAPWCAPGERPPADSAAFDRARARASQDGSLFGDTYHGKRFCVPLRGY